MILTKKALNEINVTETRLKLGLALKVTEQAVIRYITENKEDGPLTKASALKVIREETGFIDNQILLEATAHA